MPYEVTVFQRTSGRPIASKVFVDFIPAYHYSREISRRGSVKIIHNGHVMDIYDIEKEIEKHLAQERLHEGNLNALQKTAAAAVMGLTTLGMPGQKYDFAREPSPIVKPVSNRIYKLLRAIAQVETGDRDTVGDNGEAMGPFQIHHDYWKDSRVPGNYEQCHNYNYSEKVVLAYWHRFAPEALKNNDFEVLARVHNGGPNGWRNPATLGYWEKVKKALSEGY